MDTPPPLPAALPAGRRPQATIKLLVIVALVLLLQIPVHLVHEIERTRHDARVQVVKAGAQISAHHTHAIDTYRLTERLMNYDALVVVLVFTAFFLFENIIGLRLHTVHYGLVGAALCLFYLAVLALGEWVGPDWAYLGAAAASSLLITCYSAAILRNRARAAVIAGLLACVHGLLYMILQMEDYALLAGTGALFAALGAVMYFTRNLDWFQNSPRSPEAAV